MNEKSSAAALLSPIRSEDEARAWLLELVDEVEAVRQQIDLATMVREQRRLYARWMIFQGRALGVLAALKRCEMLTDVGYNELRERVMTTNRPTIVPATPSPGVITW